MGEGAAGERVEVVKVKDLRRESASAPAHTMAWAV